MHGGICHLHVVYAQWYTAKATEGEELGSKDHMILGWEKFGHVSPLLKELHWLPVACVVKRIEFKVLSAALRLPGWQ